MERNVLMPGVFDRLLRLSCLAMPGARQSPRAYITCERGTTILTCAALFSAIRLGWRGGLINMLMLGIIRLTIGIRVGWRLWGHPIRPVRRIQAVAPGVLRNLCLGSGIPKRMPLPKLTESILAMGRWFWQTARVCSIRNVKSCVRHLTLAPVRLWTIRRGVCWMRD